MSLESLFQQILLSEQQVSEKTRVLQEVKTAIARCQEKINATKKELACIQGAVEEQTRILTENELHLNILKKCRVGTEKVKQGLLEQQSGLKELSMKIMNKSLKEEEKFMREIANFNNEFNLFRNSEAMVESRVQPEILALEQEINSLRKEIDSIKKENVHVNSFKIENKSLQMELLKFEDMKKDLDRQLTEARSLTDSLRAARLKASQKPHTDRHCLRLKKELEAHKEAEQEILKKLSRKGFQY